MQDKSCTDGYKTNVIWKLCLNFSPPAKSLPWPMQREPRTRPCLGLWTMFRCMVENFPMAMAWQIRTILQVETSKESIAQSFNVVYLVHVPKYNCIFPANFKPVCCLFLLIVILQRRYASASGVPSCPAHVSRQTIHRFSQSQRRPLLLAQWLKCESDNRAPIQPWLWKPKDRLQLLIMSDPDSLARVCPCPAAGENLHFYGFLIFHQSINMTNNPGHGTVRARCMLHAPILG